MLTTIKGHFENGQIIMEEKPPVSSKTDVIITFLTENNSAVKGKRMPGGLKGKISISDDFNDPLDDLKDYM